MPSFVYTLKLKYLLKPVLFLALIFSLWYFIFYNKPVTRSESWEPMATIILNSHRSENIEDLVPHTNGFPMIIHQTWATVLVPDVFEKWIKSWLTKNDDWEYWFWTDEDMRNLIKTKYIQYLSLYDSYPAVGYRADAFRYFVLFEYGGVYADLDMEAVRSLTYFIDQHTCFVSQEPLAHAHFLSPFGIPLVSNALMGCTPGHPFFSSIISNLKDRTGLFSWMDVLRATGPYMLTSAYRTYKAPVFSDLDEASDVYLAEPDDFHPSLDSSMVDRMREMCLYSEGHSFLSETYDKDQKELCPYVLGYDFKDKSGPNSYTNHHWTHSWAGERNDPWGVHSKRDTFYVKDLLV